MKLTCSVALFATFAFAAAAQVKKPQAKAPPPVSVPASPWVQEKELQMRLISATAGVGKDTELLLALQVRLEPGWKFYWRTPGDAGIPPRFDWSESKNIEGIDVRWPRPERAMEGNLETFVYHDEVILPVAAVPERAGRPVEARLKLAYGVCREICIPYEHEMALPIGAGPATPTPFADLIRRATAGVPSAPDDVGVTLDGLKLVGAGPSLAVEVRLTGTNPFERPDLIVEGPEVFGFGKAQRLPGPGPADLVFRVPVRAQGAAPEALAGAPLTLTLLDGPLAVEISGFVAR